MAIIHAVMWVANSQLCRAFTGARLAEICGLDADDVSLGETPLNQHPASLLSG
jgi:hypothetical protein